MPIRLPTTWSFSLLPTASPKIEMPKLGLKMLVVGPRVLPGEIRLPTMRLSGAEVDERCRWAARRRWGTALPVASRPMSLPWIRVAQAGGLGGNGPGVDAEEETSTPATELPEMTLPSPGVAPPTATPTTLLR